MQVEVEETKTAINGIWIKQKDSMPLILISLKAGIVLLGTSGIIIREPDGNIKRSYSCGDVPLGNIETGFKLFDKAMPCITESCVSSADSKIPKRKTNAI